MDDYLLSAIVFIPIAGAILLMFVPRTSDFWLRAIAFNIGGVNEATARFFPALFGWGSVIAMAWFCARLLFRSLSMR